LLGYAPSFHGKIHEEKFQKEFQKISKKISRKFSVNFFSLVIKGLVKLLYVLADFEVRGLQKFRGAGSPGGGAPL
jgi:hypothetical protein